jgi:hypothetical protein
MSRAMRREVLVVVGQGYGVPDLRLLGSPEPVSTLGLDLEGPAVGAEVRAMCGRLEVA